MTEWSLAPVPEVAAQLSTQGLPAFFPALLARRGVSDPQAVQRFLVPDAGQLHDPRLLAGLPEAVERLMAAREAGETVAVVGDYDVDGVSATALLIGVLRACGLTAEPILPHRLLEGYGFQPVHVERAQELGVTVIVTVDCGTSSMAAVESATGAGIDVVITDHHLPGDQLPAGALVVNPRQEDCSYPFPDLAGVGLALKLAQAFAERCGRELPLHQLLRIACLGTIADMVPLIDENRVIAALGLEALSRTRSIGLRALMRKAGVKPPLTAADIGYRLGPRINAAGRLASPDGALELLLATDEARAQELASQLDDSNRERQREEARVVEEARALVAERSPLPPIVVAWSEGWHRGVVGIAAGRLARELCRPTVLLSLEGDAATGSGRSVPGIHLHGFLDAWRDQYERFGGHAQAIGMTLARDRLEPLRAGWEAAAASWPAALLTRRYEFELELAPREVTPLLLRELRRLEPHGQGNPQPLLRIGPLRLEGSPRLFGNGHLSAMTLGDDGGSLRLLGWGWQERAEELAGRFEVLGFLERDDYRGGAPVLRLVDLHEL
jgi:single-stranded-DNA-specific exonuclease